MQSKNRNKIKGDASYHLLKRALIKSANVNDSLSDIFIQCMYTHTHTLATHREIWRFFGVKIKCYILHGELK